MELELKKKIKIVIKFKKKKLRMVGFERGNDINKNIEFEMM